jgi:O-antigen/teichoic acid export membrane protein
MIYGIAGIAPKVVGFFMIPVYTRFLTPSDYGIMSMLMLLNSFIAIILPLGLDAAFMRFYCDCKNEREKSAVYTTALLFITVLGFITAISLSVFSSQISSILFSATKYSAYVIAMLIILLCQLAKLVPVQFVVANEKSVFYTFYSIGGFLLAISLNIYFIAILKMGVLGFIYSSLIIEVVTAVFLVIVTLPRKGLEFSFKWLKEMLKFGFPLIFSSLAMFIYMFSDRFFIEKYYSLAAVGLYSLSLQFGDIISYAIGPFLTARTPFIFSSYKEKNAKEMFSRLFTYSSLVFCFIGLGLSVCIKDVFSIVVGREFFEAYKLVPIVVLAILFRTSFYSLSIGISIMKKTGFIVYIYTVAAIVNILLLVFLIPKFGALGAAISRAITFLILLLLGYEISQKLFYIKYEFKRIAQMAILALGLYFISTFIPSKPVIVSIILKGALITAFPLVLIIIGFFEKEEIIKIKALTNLRIFRSQFLEKEPIDNKYGL